MYRQFFTDAPILICMFFVWNGNFCVFQIFSTKNPCSQILDLKFYASTPHMINSIFLVIQFFYSKNLNVFRSERYHWLISIQWNNFRHRSYSKIWSFIVQSNLFTFWPDPPLKKTNCERDNWDGNFVRAKSLNWLLTPLFCDFYRTKLWKLILY